MYRENSNIYRVLVRKREEKGLLEGIDVDDRGYRHNICAWNF
jgi:hypothetical protein